jgi:hypothetical protein
MNSRCVIVTTTPPMLHNLTGQDFHFLTPFALPNVIGLLLPLSLYPFTS